MVESSGKISINGVIHFEELEPRLRLAFSNQSSNKLVFFDDFLDPRRTSNYFAAVSNSHFRQVLQLALPLGTFNDADVAIAPGGEYVHDFALGRYFCDLGEYLRMDDVTIFWSVRLEPMNCSENVVVNGYAIVPRTRGR
jgi:hypothetical protein